MAKLKYKQKIKEIAAEQLMLDTLLDFGGGPELHKTSEWVIFDDAGNPVTTVHDVVFQKEWKVK